MKKKKYFLAIILMGLCNIGCDKGKQCMCYKYDNKTGHEIGSGYYENRSSCSSTATYLGMKDDDAYYICDEIIE